MYNKIYLASGSYFAQLHTRILIKAILDSHILVNEYKWVVFRIAIYFFVKKPTYLNVWLDLKISIEFI